MNKTPETVVLNRELLYWGVARAAEPLRELRAGALSAILRPAGQLSAIYWGETEVLHGIYVAVRNRNWGTVPANVSNVRVRQESRSFSVVFDARHSEGEIDFEWHGGIDGDAAGWLVFTMEGKALSTFLRSRIGFCVLHASEACAGTCFELQRPDGSTGMACFPRPITREQPLPGTEAMSGLTYNVTPDLRLSIDLQGDVFQMEDQRNWTDASFKTFCTPLELPCPAEIRKGTSVVQQVALSLTALPCNGRAGDTAPGDRSVSAGHTTVSVDWSAGARLPQLGLSAASENLDLAERHLNLLRCLKLSHLRVDLRLSGESWRDALRQANAEAAAIGCSLDIAAFVSGSAERELGALAAQIACGNSPVRRWLIFHECEITTPEWCLMAARRMLAGSYSAVPIGGGTNAGFFELGGLHLSSPPDFLSFSINPQEHAFDDASLVETLPIQKLAIQNARETFAGVPVVVGPVTLKPRFQAYATAPVAELAGGGLPQQVDTRQWSLFGAAWTVGSFANVLTSGAAAATYYETQGLRGLIHMEGQSPAPPLFESIRPVAFPMYHVFADVADFAGGFIHSCVSSEPLKVCALALSRDTAKAILVANMTCDAIEVHVRGAETCTGRRSLDERSAVDAMTRPETFRALRSLGGPARDAIAMLPYSVLRLDLD